MKTIEPVAHGGAYWIVHRDGEPVADGRHSTQYEAAAQAHNLALAEPDAQIDYRTAQTITLVVASDEPVSDAPDAPVVTDDAPDAEPVPEEPDDGIPPTPPTAGRRAWSAAELGWAQTQGAEVVDVVFTTAGSEEVLHLDNAPLGVTPLMDDNGDYHSHLTVARYADGVTVENPWLDNTLEYPGGHLVITVDGVVTYDGLFDALLALGTPPFRAGLAQIEPTRDWDPKLIPNYGNPPVLDEFRNRMTAERLAVDGIGLASHGLSNTGGRIDIGALPGWDLPWAVKGAAWDVCRAATDHSAVYPKRYRDPKTGRIAHPADYPTLSTYSSYLGWDRKGGQNPIATASSSPNPINTAHQPHFGIVPYLSTGSDFDLEEITSWALYQCIWGNPFYRGLEKSYVYGQVRTIAWGMLSIAWSARLLPDNHPDKQKWLDVVENNIAHWWGIYGPNGPKHNALGAHFYFAYGDDQHRARGIAPWQQHFLGAALHQVARLGFESAKPWRDFALSYAVNSMTQMAWPCASMYTHFIVNPAGYTNKGNIKASDIYTDWADVEADSLRTGYGGRNADQVGVAPAQMRINGYGPGILSGATGSSISFPANLQPALACAVDAGLPEAERAWQRFLDHGGADIDYSDGNQFNIVPT